MSNCNRCSTLAPLCDQCLLDDEAVKHRALDQAWAEINAEGGSSHNVDVYTQGYLDAIDEALGIIEKLGGMDPQKRSNHDEKEQPR